MSGGGGSVLRCRVQSAHVTRVRPTPRCGPMRHHTSTSTARPVRHVIQPLIELCRCSPCMHSRVYVTTRCPSVRPTVCLSHSRTAAVCSGFAAVGPAARRYRSIAARPARSSKCGQCHVCGRRRKLSRTKQTGIDDFKVHRIPDSLHVRGCECCPPHVKMSAHSCRCICVLSPAQCVKSRE